jgi:hypothetical protein
MAIASYTRWVLLFGAQDGFVYCLDALGDGHEWHQSGRDQALLAYQARHILPPSATLHR